MKKKICIVTGSRADYGILYPLLKQLRSCKGFQLQIVATGMHLSPQFGLTFKEIEQDGFKISAKVKLDLSKDTEAAISKSVGWACIGFAEALQRLKPDLLVVLGDRFEILAAVIAGHIAKIPIAHIHGGELTEGAMDDAFRHAITKMSLLHFTAAEEYRCRVIQLGESPDRVFQVGAMGLDNIRSLKFKTREALEKELKFSFGKKNVLITFHPATLEAGDPQAQFQELLKALDACPDMKIIFTLPNADPRGRKIIKAIENYVQRHPERAVAFASLGRCNYLSVLKQADIMIGNSSSGILEAPALEKPTVNIGLRQKGRIMAASVINCRPRSKDIAAAIRKAFSKEFLRSCRGIKSPYGDGRAAQKIVKIIAKRIPELPDIKKVFRDIYVQK